MSASLLHAIGHPELIAYSENDYLNLAINLANNPENIKKIKLSLDSGRKKSPLFNSKLLTKYIERAYITVHEQNITGSNATHVYLDHLNIK
jgi:predicted O-linked N-acetylglucosamine transferase (SPINDLY family)